MTTTTLWTSQPLLVTRNDIHGHRLRLIVHEKNAPIQTHILSEIEDAPFFLRSINPYNRYPILIDKHLACFDQALDEYLHERFPHPPLLDTVPITRAQQRVIANTIQEWFGESDPDLVRKHMRDLHELCNHQKFLFGDAYSIVDIAVAPYLWRHQTKINSIPLRKYADRLFKREAFVNSLSSQQPYHYNDDDDDVDAYVEASL